MIADKLAESTVAALGDDVEVRWVDGPTGRNCWPRCPRPTRCWCVLPPPSTRRCWPRRPN
ncbi:D-3-phosphoglycerate dehydrogenase domain protein [Mycobacterium xenopi 4042]|uniref:D-3-phosphoglycerate dehydrogenase domain protein n=1 Tax=Mycobacterium xenopi 4042 TaxID=1299334 RepID=X7Z3L3_MYCXE|nr:D-3-phosphoglycerate dehydrogenase domain protein [Mycobacterium xenopi 4042]